MHQARPICSHPVSDLLKFLACVVQNGLVYLLHLARRCRRADQTGYGVDNQAKIQFAGTNRFFRLLSVFNVGMQGIPADDMAVAITLRQTAQQKPAIYAISTAKAEFNFSLLAGFDRSSQRGDDARKIVGVNGVGPGPDLQFIKGLSKIFQYLIVDEFNFAACCQSTDIAGDTVNDLPKILLTGSQAVFSTLAIFYIGDGAVPSDDVSLLIHQRLGTEHMPSIFSVKPPNP